MHLAGVATVAGSGRTLVFFKSLWSKSLDMVAKNLGESEKGKGAST
jgi:hypothetical protein